MAVEHNNLDLWSMVTETALTPGKSEEARHSQIEKERVNGRKITRSFVEGAFQEFPHL